MVCDGSDAVVGDFEGDLLGAQKRDVLLDQAVLGLRENALEVGFAQRAQFDPEWQPALQLGQQIGGLG